VQGRPLAELVRESKGIAEYLRKMTPAQRAILEDPAKYLGAAAERTRAVCDAWERRLAGLQTL
jgi:hypothetical protein